MGVQINVNGSAGEWCEDTATEVAAIGQDCLLAQGSRMPHKNVSEKEKQVLLKFGGDYAGWEPSLGELFKMFERSQKKATRVNAPVAQEQVIVID